MFGSKNIQINTFLKGELCMNKLGVNVGFSCTRKMKLKAFGLFLGVMFLCHPVVAGTDYCTWIECDYDPEKYNNQIIFVSGTRLEDKTCSYERCAVKTISNGVTTCKGYKRYMPMMISDSNSYSYENSCPSEYMGTTTKGGTTTTTTVNAGSRMMTVTTDMANSDTVTPAITYTTTPRSTQTTTSYTTTMTTPYTTTSYTTTTTTPYTTTSYTTTTTTPYTTTSYTTTETTTTEVTTTPTTSTPYTTTPETTTMTYTTTPDTTTETTTTEVTTMTTKLTTEDPCEAWCDANWDYD